MRYWYDFEFLDTGSRIKPISVGIVAEDGRELYLVNEACDEGDFGKAIMQHPWLVENVVPHLPLRKDSPRDDGFWRLDGRKTGFRLDRDDNRVVPLRFIRNAVRDFFAVDPPVSGELWGYFPAYDHVLLAQLWGPMSHLPKHIPMRTSCIAQYADMLGIDGFDDVPMTGTAHNALDDARWTRQAWEYLEHVHTFGAPPQAMSIQEALDVPGFNPLALIPDGMLTVRRGGIPRPIAAEEALAWVDAHPDAEAPVMYEPGACPEGAACWMHAMRHVHPTESTFLAPKE